MNRILFHLFTGLMFVAPVAQVHATRLAGGPLFPALEVRGPVQHAWVGASLVNPVGTVLASSAARIELPDHALLFQAHLFWMGSGVTADTSVAIRRPDGTLIQVNVAAENCFRIGSAAGADAIHYWQCSADLSASFPELAPLGGEYRMEGLSVDTGGPYGAAQAFAGAFGLLLLYTDVTEPTPRMIQVAQGLLYARSEMEVASAALPVVDLSGTGGKLSFMALEGDVELPADGACDGLLQNAECELVGLCAGPCFTSSGMVDELALTTHFTNAANPFGNVFNETFSSEVHDLPAVLEANFNAFDLDVFGVGSRLVAGRYVHLQPIVRTGQDAIVLAAVVVELEEVDSDGDGLSDVHETDYLYTRADDVDSDGDGLSDGLEVLAYARYGRTAKATDPRSADTDGDGLCDGPNSVEGVCVAGEDRNANGARESTETDPNEKDTDGDGLSDNVERGEPLSVPVGDGGTPSESDSTLLANGAEFFSDPTRSDTDGDGLLDGQEDINGNGRFEPDQNETNPSAVDTDLGGLSDYDERMTGRNPNFLGDDGAVGDDSDEDGLTFDEESMAGSNPNLKDTDSDGLHDGIEVRGPQQTDPLNPDSDQDGIADGFEDRNQNGIRDPNESDPNQQDTDFDGLPDGLEDLNADGFTSSGETSPTDPDTDDDGLCDGPASVIPYCTGGEDVNANGVIDPGETSPLVNDTDGDGLSDGLEQLSGRYPNPDPPYERTRAYELDTDGDGLSDGFEDINRNGRRDSFETDPTAADTDGDGVGDGEEWQMGRNPLDPLDGQPLLPDAGVQNDGGVPIDASLPWADGGLVKEDGGPPLAGDGGPTDGGAPADGGAAAPGPDAGESPFAAGATFSGTTIGNCHQTSGAQVAWVAILALLCLKTRRKRFFIFSNGRGQSNV